MNLMEGLLSELDRNKELLKVYDELPTGTFGAAMIKQSIERAEQAIASGDTVEMLRCYERLKSHE